MSPSFPLVPGKSRRTIAIPAIAFLAIVATFVTLTVGHLRELHRASREYKEKVSRLRVAQRRLLELKERNGVLETEFESEKRVRALMMLKPGEKVIYLKPKTRE